DSERASLRGGARRGRAESALRPRPVRDGVLAGRLEEALQGHEKLRAARRAEPRRGDEARLVSAGLSKRRACRRGNRHVLSHEVHEDLEREAHEDLETRSSRRSRATKLTKISTR